MAKVKFQELNFQSKTLEKIALAEKIIKLYKDQGFTLTLRQLYYQMVARDLIPNNQRSYKNLGTIVGNARLAGLIDWDSIEDRLRHLVTNPHWYSPSSIIWSAAESFQIDKWEKQPCRIEIWVEKDALSGVLTPIAKKHDIGFFAARGYPSLSEMYSAGQRFARYARSNQEVHILHLGDHDPSGMDMTRDIEDRLTMFSGNIIHVNRLALNWDQIELYKPPPNPAKQTDSRFDSYVEQYGDESWELDALDPNTLLNIIEPVILELRDDAIWNSYHNIELGHKNDLKTAARNWDEVAQYVKDNYQ